MTTSTSLEEARFKREGDGWLFAAANPWIIGPRRTYLVNDEQKAALMVRVRRAKYLMLGAMVPIVAVMILVFIEAPWVTKADTLAAWLVFAALSLLLAAAIVACDTWNVQPLVRDLPRSTRKMTQRDVFRSVRDAVSVRMIVIFLVVFVLSALVQILGLALSHRNPGFALVQLAISLSFAVVCIAMLATKRQAETPPK